MKSGSGLFITFEGSEGCGKSTQIERLHKRMETTGRIVKITREPGGTLLGEELRELLKYSKPQKLMKPETELLMFAASRAQLVREFIEPEIRQGTVVLCDRFMDSTTAYQGIARAIPAEDVFAINNFAVGNCIPDLTLYMDVSPQVGMSRIRKRVRPVGAAVDRIEQEPTEFFERVRQGYKELVKAFPERIKQIDGDKSPDAVEEEIWNHVKKLLL
ncbi:MAG: dTMP kinase [Verrucomicrobiota bacterium]|nr:dTMP kinase [Verrucomicrobiota bacterium]